MTNLIQNMAGFGNMSEKVVAEDALVSSKAEIKIYASAITESSTSGVREVLRKQLNSAIEKHQKLTNFMIDNGYYFPSNVKKQLNIDFEEIDKFANEDSE